MDNDHELWWCPECWGWLPWKHDPKGRKPPWFVRLRHRAGQRLLRLGHLIKGHPTVPAFGPPPGWRRVADCSWAVPAVPPGREERSARK